MLGSNLPADFDPAAVREPNIENRHMGSQGRDPGPGLSHGRRLAHDRDAIVRLQQGSNPTADDLMIVEEKDTDIH